MAERYKDFLRGFLIPYPFIPTDIKYGGFLSDFTTHEPFADVPIPERNSGLFVGATGSTNIDSDLQVITSKSGTANSAQYLIRDNADSISIRYGNNPDCLISDWKEILSQNINELYQPYDVVSDGEGGFIIVYERTIITGSRYRISTTYIDAQNNITSNDIFEYNNGFTLSKQGKPCITKLNDGSFICLIFFETPDEFLDVMVFRSTDKTTFELASEQALNKKIDVSSGNYEVERASCEANQGQILLCISAYSNNASHTHKNHLLQYASVDGGGSFQKVTTDAMVDEFSFKSVQVYKTQNQLSIVYIGATNAIHNMVIPHAFFQIQSLRTAGQYTKINSGGSANDFSAGTDTDMTSGWVTGHMNPNNSIIVYAQDVSDKSIVCFQTEDQRNWDSMLTNSSTRRASVFFIDSNIIHFDKMISVPYNGGSAIIHNYLTSNYDIAVAYMGGFTTLPMVNRAFQNNQTGELRRTQTTFNYLPICLPSVSSELVASGTGTETLQSNYVELEVTTSQTQKIYTRTKPLLSADFKGLIVHGELKVMNDDNENAKTIVQLQFDLATGARWKVLLEAFEGRFEVFDNALSKTSILNQNIDIFETLEFMISIYDGNASFYWRYGGYDALKRWNEGFTNYNLNTAPVATVNQTITTFGINNAPTTGIANTQIYKLFCFDNYGIGDMTHLTNEDLIGKRFSTIQPQYISDGIGIFAQKGVSYIGDEWTVKATSNTSIDNIFYEISPSQRVQWWSESVSSGTNIPNQRLVFQLALNDMTFDNDIIGLHLSNINFKDAILKYWDGVLYQTVFSFETSEGMKHNYQRFGKSIQQKTPTTFDKTYYFRNELKGYVAMLTNGGNTEFYNVVSNSEGAFGDASGRLCNVVLDGEPSFDGTVYFIPTNLTVVCNLNGIKSNRWALEWPAQKTIHNQLRMGGFYLGALAIAGTQYSKGRRISIESGSITIETPDKTRYSKQFSPDRRTIQISWSDGVDISSFYDNDPDPDYYKSSSSAGALPVSAYQDAPYLIEGLLRELNGDNRPLVYLPSITTSNDNRVYNRRDEHLLAVIDGEINIESITGEELMGNGLGEVMRVGTINLLEVL